MNHFHSRPPPDEHLAQIPPTPERPNLASDSGVKLTSKTSTFPLRTVASQSADSESTPMPRTESLETVAYRLAQR